MIRLAKFLIILLANLVVFLNASHVEPIYPCPNLIYCRGPILEAVNDLHIFKDSKTYVDMPLKHSPDETLKNFHKWFPKKNNISRADLAQFVQQHFDHAGYELLPHNPTDWKPIPATFKKIQDPTYREWALDLNLKWKTLCKQMDPRVREHPERHSILELPHEFVVPGGRFREVYYWDAYWIIKGLLHSDMTQTAKAMLKNYLVLVERYGFVPNGGRIYYLKRSQPPFLIMMFRDYVEETNDYEFLASSLPLLEKEMEFWRQNRSLFINVNGESHRVYNYNSDTNTPRPESRKEDVETAKNLPEEDKANLYSNIASSAETGWDFSSRWLQDGETFRLHKTRLVLPVELNAYICGNYRILADFQRIVGDTLRARMHDAHHERCVNTMMSIFYNETAGGVWFDYHMDLEKHNLNFYPSNLVPLFTGCYKFDDERKAWSRLTRYLKDSNCLEYPNGIVTSFKKTGQQWDWPNAWAPMVHMVVEGLNATGSPGLSSIAYRIAQHWTRYNYFTYSNTTNMYEKYDIVTDQIASGGEYETQEGFGWTNGVIIDFILKYGLKFSSSTTATAQEILNGILKLV